MAGEHDYVVDEGTTFRRTVRWKIGGVPVVLTGWASRLTTLARGATAPLVLEEGEFLITNQAAEGEDGVGEITYELTPEQTVPELLGRFVIETFPLGEARKHRVLEGKFKVDKRNVTPA